jgi:hypothetical protein
VCVCVCARARARVSVCASVRGHVGFIRYKIEIILVCLYVYGLFMIFIYSLYIYLRFMVRLSRV